MEVSIFQSDLCEMYFSVSNLHIEKILRDVENIFYDFKCLKSMFWALNFHTPIAHSGMYYWLYLPGVVVVVVDVKPAFLNRSRTIAGGAGAGKKWRGRGIGGIVEPAFLNPSIDRVVVVVVLVLAVIDIHIMLIIHITKYKKNFKRNAKWNSLNK